MKMTDELKWKLQLFADDPDGGNPGGDDPDGEGNGAGGNQDPDGDNGQNQGGDGDKKYSDADVDKIVEKKFAKWKTQHEQDLEDAKAEAEKLAKMNADQKKDYELEKIKTENAKLKADAARHELGKTAADILKEHQIEATQDMLELVVGEDADSTKANIDKLVGIINAQIKAAEVERATGKTPKNYGDTGTEKTEFQKRIEKYK